MDDPTKRARAAQHALLSNTSPRELRMATETLCQRLADLGSLPPREDATTAPTAHAINLRGELLQALTALYQIKNHTISVYWDDSTITVDDLQLSLERHLTQQAARFFRDLRTTLHAIHFTTLPTSDELGYALKALRELAFSGTHNIILPVGVSFDLQNDSEDDEDWSDDIADHDTVFDTIADLRAFTNNTTKTLDTFINIQQTLHTLLEHTHALTKGQEPIPWRALHRLTIQTFNALQTDADGLIACLLLDTWETQADTTLLASLLLSVEVARQTQVPHQAIPDIAIASMLHALWYCAHPERLPEDNVLSMLRTLQQLSVLGPLSLPPLFLAILSGDPSNVTDLSSHTVQRARLVRLITDFTYAWISATEHPTPSLHAAFDTLLNPEESTIEHPENYVAVLFHILATCPPGTIILTKDRQHAVALRNLRPHHRSFLLLSQQSSPFHVPIQNIHNPEVSPILGITGSASLAQRAKQILFARAY